MTLRATILIWALPLVTFTASPLSARPKTDVLVMNNGDRITCEIKALDSSILYVSFDYIKGTTEVDWSKVHHIESKQLFIIRTENGSVYTGSLLSMDGTAGRPIQIRIPETPPTETAPEPVTVEQSKIVEVTQTSKTFWKSLNGSINSGLTYSKANQSTQYNLSSTVVYPQPRWSVAAAFNSTLNANTGATASTRNTLDLSFTRLLRWNNWYYGALGNFLQSSEQGISLQSDIGGGLGYYFKNTNRATISMIGGLAWQNTRYSQSTGPQTQRNVSAGLVGAQVKLFKFNKTNLTVKALVFPAFSEPGRVYFVTNATYYVKIWSGLTLNLSFYGNWDNRPPAHLAGSNYGATTGFGWTFGNR